MLLYLFLFKHNKLYLNKNKCKLKYGNYIAYKKNNAITAGMYKLTQMMSANIWELPDKTKSAEPPQHIIEQ